MVLSFTTNLCLYVDYQLEYHLRIPVLKYGSPGPLGLVADNLRADDFVFGASRVVAQLPG
jgi:hypothetical protein